MLLDTCALIWLAMGGGELTQSTLKAMDKERIIYVSSISAFEIAHKYWRGGIELPCEPEQWFLGVLDRHDITEIQIDSRIAMASTKLPPIHRDPCDRFIIATARLNGFKVVTGDSLFKRYGVEVLV